MPRDDRLAGDKDDIETAEGQPMKVFLRRPLVKNGFNAGMALMELLKHKVKIPRGKRSKNADVKLTMFSAAPCRSNLNSTPELINSWCSFLQEIFAVRSKMSALSIATKQREPKPAF